MRLRSLCAGLLPCLSLLIAAESPAVLIVDPPLPITRQVRLHLIDASEDDGSAPATALGDETQRAGIESRVDRIWAQAGIDVFFEPQVELLNSSFALRGTISPRPSSDLGLVLQAAREQSLLSPDGQTLNLVFVDIVPGFTSHSEYSAAGIANRPGNGINIFVGESLLQSTDGLDSIASVIAHEIGHNLGLGHTSAGTANLMSPGRTSNQLTRYQIDQVLLNPFGFLRPYTPLVGDVNGDGSVDAADYTLWRDSLGSTTNLEADADRDGVIDQDDYQLWSANYTSAVAVPVVVPEPAGLIAIGAAAALAGSRRPATASRWCGRRG